MELSSEDRGELEDLEESLWRAETRFDIKLMDQIFSADFFEFGRSGRVYGRQECLNVESQPIDARLPLENLRVRLISPDVAQVTYVSSVTYDGIEELANRSSIWTRAGNGWQLRFHQGTAIYN
ncbi:MAG: nuclear transport factor 2 family protein [Dehalococcoidia bacterium]|nr:nuclear transport factor 2 family protein [Dehalococcoidia bacterium]